MFRVGSPIFRRPDLFIARFGDTGYNTALPDGAWRSPASALAWGARGPGFNSRRPDTKDSTDVESFDSQDRVSTAGTAPLLEKDSA